MDSVNVACIGIGYWGKNLVRNFYDLPGANLRTCCDLNRDLLEQAAVRYPGVATTTDFAAVLQDPRVDAVVIASPASAHYSLALKALESGKHVYVEKPLCLRSSEAAHLCEVAEQRDLRLMVGHLMEYHPAVNALKALVDGGELGDIRYLYAQRLNLGIIRQDENALWSLAPHDVSIATYLLDEDPISVSARGQSYLQPGIEDVVFCNIEFPGGKVVNIQVSWLDPNKVRRVTVVGSEKMAVFDDVETSEKIRIYDKGVGSGSYQTYGDALTLRTGDITIPAIEMSEPLRTEARHFVDAVRTGSTPRSDGHDGLRVVKILEAADQSLKRNGEPVYVDRPIKAA